MKPALSGTSAPYIDTSANTRLFAPKTTWTIVWLDEWKVEQSGQEQNHRGDRRQRVLKGALITFKDRAATINCVVRNLSDSGACLKVDSPIGIPDAFDLIFDDHKSIRHCRVTWRKATQIGIEFA